MVSDLDAIVAIYKDTETFVSSGAFPDTVKTLFGSESLLFIDGEGHARKRASVRSAFSPQLFSLYFRPIFTSAQHLWQNVSQQVHEEGPISLHQAITDHYLRVIIQITSGLDMTANAEGEHECHRILKLFKEFTEGMFSVPVGPIWNRAMNARRELHRLYKDLIRERLVHNAHEIEKMRESGDKLPHVVKKDLKKGSLDILTVAVAFSSLETGPGHVHDEAVLSDLADLVLLLWFAGSFTTASSTLSAIMEMSFETSIMQRLRAEQEGIMETAGSEEVTTAQVFREMPLLDSYISEIFRMYPASPTIFRKVNKDAMVCGHLIKAGETIGLDSWGGQRNSKYFADPDTLKVDRFMPDSKERPIRLVTFGSSGSPHYCLGSALSRINMKATLAILLREYDLAVDMTQSRKYDAIPHVQPTSGVRIVQCSKRDSNFVKSKLWALPGM